MLNLIKETIKAVLLSTNIAMLMAISCLFGFVFLISFAHYKDYQKSKVGPANEWRDGCQFIQIAPSVMKHSTNCNNHLNK